MSDLPPVQAIVSNPETQLKNPDASSISMSNNDTLPASVLEVRRMRFLYLLLKRNIRY